MAVPQSGQRKARVLIVDDNHDCADTYALLISQWGHEARTAYDADTCFTSAQTFQPDIILLDVALPGRNGYELARQLRREKSLHGVMIVSMTGYTDPLHTAYSRDAGCDQHFVKPLDAQTLRAILAHVASRLNDSAGIILPSRASS